MINGLAERLRELRIQNNLSQKTVAEKLRVSASVVSGYENGERTPSTNVLLSLSYLYKCSTDYLLGKQSDKPIYSLDLSGLTPEQIQALATLIETIRA